jgi:transcriptional regulator with XRE-family HTH domain
MEMILSHDDLINPDYSNRVKGCGWTSQSVIGGFLLGILTGPGAASAQKQDFSVLDSTTFPQIQLHDFAVVEVVPAVVPVAELINTIKYGWALNMTELAELMGVQRPTLYNWLKGKTSPDAKLQKQLQSLAAAAADWKDATAGSNWDFLLDYTGPKADEVTIREVLSRADASTSEIREMVHTRMTQYQKAYVQSREILGEPPALPNTAPPESARRLNAMWAENAKKLHRFRNSSS